MMADDASYHDILYDDTGRLTREGQQCVVVKPPKRHMYWMQRGSWNASNRLFRATQVPGQENQEKTYVNGQQNKGRSNFSPGEHGGKVPTNSLTPGDEDGQ